LFLNETLSRTNKETNKIRTNERMSERMDRRADGWMDGWMRGKAREKRGKNSRKWILISCVDNTFQVLTVEENWIGLLHKTIDAHVKMSQTQLIFESYLYKPTGYVSEGWNSPLNCLNKIILSFSHCKRFLSDLIFFDNLPLSFPKGQCFSYFVFNINNSIIISYGVSVTSFFTPIVQFPSWKQKLKAKSQSSIDLCVDKYAN